LWVVAAAVAVLYVLHFSGKKTTEVKRSTVGKDSATNEVPQQIKVAYIDLDTIQKYYEYFKFEE
jgi:hypothetical protein